VEKVYSCYGSEMVSRWFPWLPFCLSSWIWCSSSVIPVTRNIRKIAVFVRWLSDRKYCFHVPCFSGKLQHLCRRKRPVLAERKIIFCRFSSYTEGKIFDLVDCEQSTISLLLDHTHGECYMKYSTSVRHGSLFSWPDPTRPEAENFLLTRSGPTRACLDPTRDLG
jgi:hypothetical protein